MAEYIEREALIKRIRLLPRFAPYNTVRYASVQNAIFDEPIADVVEVRHGYWIETEESFSHKTETMALCSVCGRGQLVSDAFPFESVIRGLNYCQNCGAKMDLKEGAENG